jgi:hypothetical protein
MTTTGAAALAHVTDEVDAAPQGLLKTTLEPLRDGIGWKKLSKNALPLIAEALEEAGLTPLGSWIFDPSVNTEPRYWQTVYLVRTDSSAGRIVRAVLDPDADPDVLDAFSCIAPANSAAAKLEAIRKIVLQ